MWKSSIGTILSLKVAFVVQTHLDTSHLNYCQKAVVKIKGFFKALNIVLLQKRLLRTLPVRRPRLHPRRAHASPGVCFFLLS